MDDGEKVEKKTDNAFDDNCYNKYSYVTVEQL